MSLYDKMCSSCRGENAYFEKKTKLAPDDWYCDDCQVLNKFPPNSNCKACAQENLVLAEMKAASNQVCRAERFWLCFSCGHGNSMEKKVCMTCYKERKIGESKAAKKIGSMFKQNFDRV